MEIMDHINDIKERIKELEKTQDKLKYNEQVINRSNQGINECRDGNCLEDYKVLAAHYSAKKDINLDALDLAAKLYIDFRFNH